MLLILVPELRILLDALRAEVLLDVLGLALGHVHAVAVEPVLAVVAGAGKGKERKLRSYVSYWHFLIMEQVNRTLLTRGKPNAKKYIFIC